MLNVASQSIAPPYCAVTFGPKVHSPPPMAAAPITSPGPIMPIQLRQVKTGASGSSPTVHCGICFEPGYGAPVSDGTWTAESFGGFMITDGEGTTMRCLTGMLIIDSATEAVNQVAKNCPFAPQPVSLEMA